MAELDELTEEQVLIQEASPDYGNLKASLHPSLVTLHSNVSILRQLREYPWDLFDFDDRFFGYLQYPIFRYSIIVACRLWGDPDTDSTGVDDLKRRVFEDWIRPEYKDSLRNRFRPISRERPDGDLFSRLREARNRRLAHLDSDFHLGDFPVEDTLVTIDELAEVAEWNGRVFNALCFGEDHFLVLNSLWYRGDPTAGALGWVLECMAVQSTLVQSYEENPDWWCRKKLPELTEDDQAELNRLREKFNLPAIEE